MIRSHPKQHVLFTEDTLCKIVRKSFGPHTVRAFRTFNREDCCINDPAVITVRCDFTPDVLHETRLAVTVLLRTRKTEAKTQMARGRGCLGRCDWRKRRPKCLETYSTRRITVWIEVDLHVFRHKLVQRC